MQDYEVIDRNNPLPASQDFNLLRREGIEHLGKLAGDKWTDYNTPDPGITLLEALCYAITEMGYRTKFKIQDLITYKNPGDTTWNCIFYTAKELLHTCAITINDYRKLILDVDGVRNVWIEKSTSYEVPIYVDQEWTEKEGHQHQASEDPCAETCSCAPKRGRLTTLGNAPVASHRPLELEGLYNVLVQYEEDINETPAEDKVHEAVLKRLHKHRNLCEDFINVIPVRPQKFTVDINVVLKPDADPEKVLAQIFIEIYRYFSPTIRFYTIDQMLDKPYPYTDAERNYRIEEIFEGPALESGFIEDDELEKTDMFRDIRLSDLINEIADIEGVRAITRLHIPRDSMNYEFFTKWITELREQRKVGQLDIDKSRAMLCKDSEIFQYDVNTDAASKRRVKKIYRDLLARERSYRLKGHQTDFAVPTGEYSDLDVYVPVKNDLPHIYGVHPVYGIPGSTDLALREAQAKQLKGYLLLFDQLLANHLAQLAHLNKIFSFCDTQHTQYFQVLHQDVQYNLDELFIGDEQALTWKNELLGFENQQEEKSVELEFLNDDIAELQERVHKLDKALMENPADKRLKRKLHTASKTLLDEQTEAKNLEKELGQIAQSIAGLQTKIGQAEKAIGAVADRMAEVLKGLLDAPKLFVRRRSRMLNHLLARFGENTTEYDHLMQLLSDGSPIDLERRLIVDKMRLLKDYVRVSNRRSKGFSYWGTPTGKKKKAHKKAHKKSCGGKSISGLERRVSRLLGYSEVGREYLTPSWVEVEPLPGKAGKTGNAVIRCFTDDADHRLLFNSKEVTNQECCIDEFIQILIERGSDPHNYQQHCEERSDKTTYFFGLYDGDIPLGMSRRFNTGKESKAYQERLGEQFKNLFQVEGMHLVEHILLRPKTDEVLQYADKNPYDTETPPAEPVKLLCIDLDACDHCGDCCFEIGMVEMPEITETKEEKDTLGTTITIKVVNLDIQFINPFNPEKAKLVAKDESGTANLPKDKKEALQSAIQNLKNYSLSDDKKTVIISGADKYPLATIALTNLPVKKPKVSEITSIIKETLVNNQIIFSFPSPFKSDQRLHVRDFDHADENVSAYKLDALLKGIYKIDGSRISKIGDKKISIPIRDGSKNVAQIEAQTNDEPNEEVARKVREALLRCLSVRSFKIRITRLPKEKCFNDEAWALEISALKNAQDPASDRIVFYRRVYQVEDTWKKPLMAFRKYEQLSDYLARIRVVANEEENYRVLAHGARFSIALQDDQGFTLAQTDYVFDNAAEAETWAEDMRRAFAFEQQRNCLCQGCNHNEDPYSFRATVVLPCWSKRAQNKAFRLYTEQTLRLETPGHIDLRIVWLGMGAMRRFEAIYRKWLLEMVENNGMPELEVVNKLVHELDHLKDCADCAPCDHSKGGVPEPITPDAHDTPHEDDAPQ
ncbi:MAG: hypothetical protein H6574_18905 [Lewinellaceae bacterium]|nr:hypothetical protein [Lewinellaceae bacterium]